MQNNSRYFERRIRSLIKYIMISKDQDPRIVGEDCI